MANDFSLNLLLLFFIFVRNFELNVRYCVHIMGLILRVLRVWSWVPVSSLNSFLPSVWISLYILFLILWWALYCRTSIYLNTVSGNCIPTLMHESMHTPKQCLLYKWVHIREGNFQIDYLGYSFISDESECKSSRKYTLKLSLV